jgi:hypothetical protein
MQSGWCWIKEFLAMPQAGANAVEERFAYVEVDMTEPDPLVKICSREFERAPVANRRAGCQPAPQRSRAATTAAC